MTQVDLQGLVAISPLYRVSVSVSIEIQQSLLYIARRV
jgi:hypothetical protein